MALFDSILVPIDYSLGARHALAVAAGLRKRAGARITCLHAFEPVDALPFAPIINIDYTHGAWRDEGKKRLTEFVREALPSIGEFDVSVERGRPGDVIRAEADRLEADLVVMGTHGRTGLRRVLLGSVAEEVLRRAACPVLTVGEDDDGAKTDEPRETIRSILVPIDFSDHSSAGVHLAAAVAATFDAEVHILHVIDLRAREAHEPLIEDTQSSMDEIYAAAMKDARDAILRERASLEKVGPGPAIQDHVILGNPNEEIPRQAQQLKVDLIVIGSQGRTSLGDRLLGSTAERVVRLAECPVLTLRTSAPD